MKNIKDKKDDKSNNKVYKTPTIHSKGSIVTTAGHGCHDSWKGKDCSKTW